MFSFSSYSQVINPLPSLRCYTTTEVESHQYEHRQDMSRAAYQKRGCSEELGRMCGCVGEFGDIYRESQEGQLC